MISYTVIVDTREGDRFRGIYPTVPTRDQVIEGIRSSGTDAKSVTRLIALVKTAKNWPDRIVARRVEVVRVEATIIGKIVFDVQRGR
ncbi:MAG: hypothetical protein WC315_00395 [Candidatus Omnitrophota bacterium]|jgi:hypothetical protein